MINFTETHPAPFAVVCSYPIYGNRDAPVAIRHEREGYHYGTISGASFRCITQNRDAHNEFVDYYVVDVRTNKRVRLAPPDPPVQNDGDCIPF